MMFLWLVALSARAGALEDGIVALQDGHHAEARATLESAVAASPSDVEAWWQLGWARYELGDYPAAAVAWERVRTLQPDHADLAQWLGAARTRASLAAAAPVAVDVPTERAGGTLRFVAGGDTMMGSDRVKGDAGLAPGDGEALFQDVGPLFAAADVAFVNLEGPLADGLPSTKCAPGSTDCHAFRTPTRYVNALTAAGVDLVCLANNHAMDLGTAGMESTMATLDAAGIAHAGRYGDVARLERDGVRVAMVGGHSGSCCLNVNDPVEVARAVAAADVDADLVVFAYHGGAEGGAARHVLGKVEIAWGEARGDVRALSRAAVDAGADLVLGTGPHVLRAMEVYRGRMIAYSLGNLMGYRQFGTGGGYGGTTVLLDVELASNGVLVSGRLHPLLLDGESVPHVDPAGAGLGMVEELSAADFADSGVRVADDGTLSWGP
jgi:hypothetical protein